MVSATLGEMVDALVRLIEELVGSLVGELDDASLGEIVSALERYVSHSAFILTN